MNPEDYEPKFFGISSKSFPSGFKFLYLLIVGGAIAGVIYIGYNKATEEERNISKKKDKKKSKKEWSDELFNKINIPIWELNNRFIQ